jgi:hypothetical protein
MAKIMESTPQRLVLQSGSTAVALDKTAGTATLQRKMLFFSLKPVEHKLADITDVNLDTVTDPASHAEIDHVMLKLRAGGGWALAADSRKEAQALISQVRQFLGMSPA